MAISEPKSAHLRKVLLFAFNWKKGATEAHRMLEEVYSDHALSKSQCYSNTVFSDNYSQIRRYLEDLSVIRHFITVNKNQVISIRSISIRNLQHQELLGEKYANFRLAFISEGRSPIRHLGTRPIAVSSAKIDGKAITWINDFLKNRYIRVKYNGTLSKTFKLYQGLPQGSVLSPTLFTLFIAGIEEKISHKTNIGLFADDIILWSSNTNWKKAERDLNKTLFHLEKFANKHKLEFNPQKSETCLFTTDKKLYKIRPKIILKAQQLQYNKHPKYLGYTLDPEINSSKHIEEVIRKGRDRLKILKYISGREWGADATTLKLTYTSLIRPILEYGYQIYGTASETNLKITGKDTTKCS
ncbi:hypothetical protein LAZ67_12001528 [Cordylochernes scorpioides]|uniref:Reverse transcriptase domain-containing protein n=1 Tax=Cordylochernes scorpioides TaxID=51811 RepID=A0ABY6L3W2_9ARAC|nr:hypothetical protein LAZ67_12001528 [Cordylochernes scorpioides]